MVAFARGVDGQSIRESLIEALSRLARNQSRLIELLVAFDESGEWAFDGARSCAHWVAQRADLELCTIREWLRIGHRLEKLDEIAARFAANKLSYSKVRTLVRIATPENQHELCAIADRVTAGEFPRALAKWLEANESPEDHARRMRAATALRSHLEPEGTVMTTTRLPPDLSGQLHAAIDAKVLSTQRGRRVSADADSPRCAVKWPSIAQQRADALLALVLGGGAKVSSEVIIHVRGDGCTLDNGTPIAGSLVERLVPTAFLRVLIHDAERRPINASGRHRHPTTRQKRVVRERERRCVDCGSTDLLQYDHDPPFEESHRTVVDELKPRCPPCHHKRHGDDASGAERS
jgi:hypothetical protein